MGLKEQQRAAPPVAPGLMVETFDGQRLGIVEAAEGEGFTVHPRLRDEFWLPEGLVREVDDQRVLLHINSRVVSRYKRKESRSSLLTSGWMSGSGIVGLSMMLLLSVLALAMK